MVHYFRNASIAIVSARFPVDRRGASGNDTEGNSFESESCKAHTSRRERVTPNWSQRALIRAGMNLHRRSLGELRGLELRKRGDDDNVE